MFPIPWSNRRVRSDPSWFDRPRLFALSIAPIVSQTRNQRRLIVAQQPLRLCALFVQVVS